MIKVNSIIILREGIVENVAKIRLRKINSIRVLGEGIVGNNSLP